ncbi:MAG: hypothetical protein LUE93_12515 [Bacteroides sp.]|nr:hypothetical protein [Bacteroides sp.]
MNKFFPKKYKLTSKKKRFGLCDCPPPPHQMAYLDEKNGENWIAVVENFYEYEINFIPVDYCIELKRPDHTMDNRCDCFLFHETTIVFVELKQRNEYGSKWVADGEKQLRATIRHFEKRPVARDFTVKKAYIANSAKPLFRTGQMVRMENFYSDTGYILLVKNRIHFDNHEE